MVKAYLRYDLASTFGVVASNSNVVYDHTGKLMITASLENIAIWNVKQGTLVCIIARRGSNSQSIRSFSTVHSIKNGAIQTGDLCLWFATGQITHHSCKFWQGSCRSHSDSSWQK